MYRGTGIEILRILIAIGVLSTVIPLVLARKKHTLKDYDRDFCQPLIIAHRGACGYVPEHTLGSYALAATMGADYIEPDVVMTKDRHLIACHGNKLDQTTDVSQYPEFSSRCRTQFVDGKELTGWFTEDFTLAEIKTLRTIERIPNIRPGNQRLNTAFDVPTIQEIIDLVKGLEISLHRRIGIFPEIKHSLHFRRLNPAIEKPLVDLLQKNGYNGPKAPVYIQSFEVNNLKMLKNMTDIRLIQLLDSAETQPFDQNELGTSLTYGKMATAEGLREIATYAYAVGPEKSYIIPRDPDCTLGVVTNFVKEAHAAGLKVHTYTFRSENFFLPAEYRGNDYPNDLGYAEKEIRDFLETGIDGMFTDQPDDAIRVRGKCDS